jgi:hypothetical protein
MKSRNFLIALSLLPIFFAGAFLGSAAGFDPVNAGLAFAGLAVVRVVLPSLIPGIKMASGMLATSIDISALATALGAYHREHRDIIFNEMLLDEDFTQDLEVLDDITDQLPLPNLSLTDLTKPANATTFSPTANALAFNARILQVRGIKVDLQLIPQVLEKTWLGKQKRATDPWDMPFEAFIMSYINSKITSEIRLKSLYKGVYNGAGTTPTDNFNGFLKLIVDEITATTIAPVVTGAITSANVIDKVELTYDALGDAYKAKPSIMKVAPVIFDWYVRKYRVDYGKNLDYTGMAKNKVTIDGTMCDMVREPGLSGSQRLICSPKENFIYGVDSTSGYSMDVQKFDRTLKILIDFKAGVNFSQVHARALAVNDQA